MVAIETRYLGPTKTKGARIVAGRMDKHGKRVIIPWDHAQTTAINHKLAAEAFAASRGWQGRAWKGGSTDTGYVWVSDTWLKFGLKS
jgi:hypothetical protein